MSSDPHSRPAIRDPWSAPMLVAQIPVTGSHVTIEATLQQAAAIATAGGLRHVKNLRAEFTVTPARGDQVRVEGRLTGEVGQTCVVTLEPLNTAVDEAIELIFAPAEQVRSLAATMEDDEMSERPDPPEPIERGIIDLGRVATDALFLGLDPYPRKPDAVFEPPVAPVDPEDHPFAALKALKSDQ